MDKVDTGFAQEASTVLIRVVAGVDDSLDTGVDNHFGACQTRLVGDVDHASVGADAMEGGLDDGVLLGVERAHAVVVDDQVANDITVGKAGWRAVVAGGQNASAADDNCADMGAIAGAAGGHGGGDLEKVLVPGGANELC